METHTGLSHSAVELKTIFEQLKGDRSNLESRWIDYAGWTLPYLYPEDDVLDGAEMQHDYQALGAQAVNHLANKITTTLFAPARPFFRLELTPDQNTELVNSGLKPADIEVLTAKVEKQAMRNMEKVRMRTSVISGVKALIGLGNTMLYFPEDGGKSQVYQLHDYVVKRDASGTVIQIICRDRRVVRTLPPEVRTNAVVNGLEHSDKVDLFTGITMRDDGKYWVKQEINELMIVPGKPGIYPAKDLPWLALAWNLTRGQDYGNGLVEEYAGDFSVFSSLSESTLNLASIAADIKGLVNPAGQTDVDALNNAPTGAFVHGTLDDIAYLQLEKMGDFQFVTQVMETYQRRIAAAFLMGSQVTRDAERVTAVEIRMNANELESSLGGVYSRLAEEMQQPIARRAVASVDSDLKDMEPVILTGVESLSRNSEHEEMMLFLNDLAIINSIPESMQGELDLNAMAKLMASNRGIESQKFMKTAEQKKAEQQAAQQQAQADAAAQGAERGAQQAAGQQSQPIV